MSKTWTDYLTQCISWLFCRCLWCLIWRRLPVVVSWCSWSATKKSWKSWDGWSRRWRASLCLHLPPPQRVWGQQLCQAQGGIGWAAVGDQPCRPSEVLLLQVRHLFFYSAFYVALNLRNRNAYWTICLSPIQRWPRPPCCTKAVRFQLIYLLV